MLKPAAPDPPIPSVNPPDTDAGVCSLLTLLAPLLAHLTLMLEPCSVLTILTPLLTYLTLMLEPCSLLTILTPLLTHLTLMLEPAAS